MIIVADNILLILPSTLTQWSRACTLPPLTLGSFYTGSLVVVECTYRYVKYTGISVDALARTVPLPPLVLTTAILHALSLDCSPEPGFPTNLLWWETHLWEEIAQRTTFWALFSGVGPQESNSDEGWQEGSLPAEPSCWPNFNGATSILASQDSALLFFWDLVTSSG